MLYYIEKRQYALIGVVVGMDDKRQEDTLLEEEEDLTAELLEQSERRRKRVRQIVSAVLVIALLLNVASAWPHVVRLEAIQFLQTSYRLYQDEGMRERKQSVVSVVGRDGKGTGFVIDASGVVITNDHVIAGQKGIYLHLPSGESKPTIIDKSFPEHDLAILRVEGDHFEALSYAPQYRWREGERVTFIGNPLGYLWIANEGELLGTTRVEGIDHPVMVIRAPVYRGNSGSPVFNQEGEVIGVLFATLALQGETMGLAVSIDHIIGEW
ncbi:serine protease [Ammoniphilus sp. CFH 90114]|uniref:S1 family peptidase n=1 Tax=Ammoniphilus sp. CFH 90114 TaxID=2493665 RepID=UPI00100DD7A1|nr:serine protease [Ammoniphilus sp. CFH 90114]RXT15451.1 serine protease [Ammoniphilus sp. CFH 90114]